MSEMAAGRAFRCCPTARPWGVTAAAGLCGLLLVAGGIRPAGAAPGVQVKDEDGEVVSPGETGSGVSPAREARSGDGGAGGNDGLPLLPMAAGGAVLAGLALGGGFRLGRRRPGREAVAAPVAALPPAARAVPLQLPAAPVSPAPGPQPVPTVAAAPSGQPPRGAARRSGSQLEVALSAVRAGSSRAGLPPVNWLEVGREAVDMVLVGPAAPPAGFTAVTPERWRIARATLHRAALGTCAISPVAALAPVGATGAESLIFVDLEASGIVVVDGSASEVADMLRGLVMAVAHAPWPERAAVLVVGMSGTITELGWVDTVDTLAEALDRADAFARRTRAVLDLTEASSLGQARAMGLRGETWAPLVVISAVQPSDPEDRRRLRELGLQANSGLAFVVPPPVDGILPGRRLSLREGRLLIDGLAEAVQPRAVPEEEAGGTVVIDVDATLGALRSTVPRQLVRGPVLAQVPTVSAGVPTPATKPAASADAPPTLEVPVPPELSGGPEPEPTVEPGPLSPFAPPPGRTESTDGVSQPATPAWTVAGEAADLEGSLGPMGEKLAVLIRVLGQVEALRIVSGRVEERMVPPRPKALEAVVYLALRESGVDREALEIRLFPDSAKGPKAMYNTISAARALLGEALFPPPAAGRYSLAASVRTDYALFRDLVSRAESTRDTAQVVALLSDALRLVRGEPFAGAGVNYAWARPHRDMIVADVVDAADELAEIHFNNRQWAAADRAARQGLRADPRAERLYRVLMRSAAAGGDPEAVRRVYGELCGVLSEPGEEFDPTTALEPETLALVNQLTS